MEEKDIDLKTAKKMAKMDDMRDYKPLKNKRIPLDGITHTAINKKSFNERIKSGLHNTYFLVTKLSDVKSAIEWYRQYADSGRMNFKKDYPEEYLEYIEKGTKEKWDFESDESWNSWLIEQAFPDLYLLKKEGNIITV